MSEPTKEMLEWIDGQILGQEQITGDLIKTHGLLRPDEQQRDRLVISIAREDLIVLHAIRSAIEEGGRLNVQIAYWRGWAQGLRKEAGNLRIKDVKLIDEIADFKLDEEEGKGE